MKNLKDYFKSLGKREVMIHLGNDSRELMLGMRGRVNQACKLLSIPFAPKYGAKGANRIPVAPSSESLPFPFRQLFSKNVGAPFLSSAPFHPQTLLRLLRLEFVSLSSSLSATIAVIARGFKHLLRLLRLKCLKNYFKTLFFSLLLKYNNYRQCRGLVVLKKFQSEKKICAF